MLLCRLATSMATLMGWTMFLLITPAFATWGKTSMAGTGCPLPSDVPCCAKLLLKQCGMCPVVVSAMEMTTWCTSPMIGILPFCLSTFRYCSLWLCIQCHLVPFIHSCLHICSIVGSYSAAAGVTAAVCETMLKLSSMWLVDSSRMGMTG